MTATADGPADPARVLAGRGYHVLLLAAAALGAPVALVAFGFLALVTVLEDAVWETLPHALGQQEPSAWYAVLVVGVAGLLVGLVVARLPGRGGHIPVEGLGGGPPRIVDLPGLLLAALASLALGTVVGPEAPLTALGGGLVVLAVRRTPLGRSPSGTTVLAAAGSAAALGPVFGNPLIAAILMLEIVGLSGSGVLLVLLPCLLSAGIGGLLFTGLGSWTGIAVPSLTIPGLPAAAVSWPALLWTVPIAVLAALAAQLPRRLGRRSAALTARSTILATTVAGLVVGGCGAAYHLLTGRSVLEVLQSGEKALVALVGAPHAWPIVALVLLLAAKGLAYGVSLGAFRGGPTFPAVFLGAALGVLVSPLPGLGTTAGIAIGMTAATTAVLRLPVTSVILVVLLLGAGGTDQVPVIMVAAAIAMVTAVVLDGRRPDPGKDSADHPAEDPADHPADHPAEDPADHPAEGTAAGPDDRPS
ncbi:MAG TPA: chloride channel protein [Actinomycetospora sp.]|jgi:H+/Cl- antiporter ClcA|uniref:chloride channel protein n=1 Tax=Actinomycetospora sp. TaxID=1872135 RepID=UPI002F423C1C